VLSVGVNEYDGDLRLKNAVSDANGLADALAANSRSLFPRGLDVARKTDKQANKAGVLAALDALKGRVKPQDVTIVFFAGHGHIEPVDEKSSKYYLLPHGVDLDKLPATAISEDELKTRLVAIEGRVVLILDACHGGTVNIKGLAGRRAAGTTDRLERSFSDEQVGVVVWLAASSNQVAVEAGDHGLFTKSLMDGLGGKAKRDARNVIHLFSLQHYVLDEVSARTNYKQVPGLFHPPSIIPYPVAMPPDDKKP
jgi:uncharacterized caspase-like protein